MLLALIREVTLSPAEMSVFEHIKSTIIILLDGAVAVHLSFPQSLSVER